MSWLVREEDIDRQPAGVQMQIHALRFRWALEEQRIPGSIIVNNTTGEVRLYVADNEAKP
jgi:hypothetical protein